MTGNRASSNSRLRTFFECLLNDTAVFGDVILKKYDGKKEFFRTKESAFFIVFFKRVE